MSGIFKIPLDTYYEVSKEIKSKVTELADSVEDDFLNKVSANIGFLDDRDASIVESFSSYTNAKTELETLRQHETNLNNMSMEGGSNPLNGVVSTDNSYTSTFSGLADGSQNSQIASVTDSLSQAVTSEKQSLETIELIREYSKSISDNDFVQRLLMLTKTNPAKALEKLLGNEEFLTTIAKDGKIDNFFWKVMTYINDSEKVPEALMSSLADNSKFVEWAGKLSVSSQDKLLNTMINISEKGFDLLNKGGKVIEWATKIAESRPVKILSKFANTGIGKVITSPWVLTGAKGVVSGVSSYMDVSSDAYHDVGKAAVGGTIEAIASIGPIDGVLMGASVAGPWGAVGGSLLGFLIQGTQFFYPDLKDDLKEKAYEAVDTVREVGKSVASTVDNVVTSAGKQISESTKNFAKNVTEVGQSASKLLSSISISTPTLNWFG